MLAAFALGIFFGNGFVTLTMPSQRQKIDFADRDESFKYIRTAAETRGSDEHRVTRELAPFRYKVKALIDERTAKNDARAVSVYFRDLNNGTWFGIGEKEKISSRSLLKLPLMIAYFKWAEANPLVLRKSLTYSSANSAEGGGGEKSGMEPGRQYTVNDLIFRMITEDNSDAYSLLFANIPRPRIDKVFKDLNVEYDPHRDEDVMSLRAFASFYRVLFNASYLNEEMSEKALRYLAKPSLISSGVPFNVEIAGKTGMRTVKIPVNGKEEEFEQIHQICIIYHSRRPFLIGIMARGEDPDSLVKVIRDVTKLVYEEVDQQS